jgi:hypothetical protein
MRGNKEKTAETKGKYGSFSFEFPHKKLREFLGGFVHLPRPPHQLQHCFYEINSIKMDEWMELFHSNELAEYLIN